MENGALPCAALREAEGIAWARQGKAEGVGLGDRTGHSPRTTSRTEEGSAKASRLNSCARRDSGICPAMFAFVWAECLLGRRVLVMNAL